MIPERRKAPRFTVEQLVQLSMGREEWMSACALNISRIGILCRTKTYIDPGSRVFLMLGLESALGRTEHINVEGVVSRSDAHQGDYHTGIYFTDVSARARETLDAFIARLEAASSTTPHA